MRFSFLAASYAALAGFVSAHPGHDLTEEIAERRDFVNAVRQTSLSHCAEKLKARGIEARNIARRSAAVDKARSLMGLDRRDLDDALSESHNETDTGYTENTSPSDLFTGNSSCVLTPEVTQGPYYVGGEYVRQDVTDSQKGVDITLDYQVIDVDTCEPVENVFVEIWHCNSTGVYSGINASGNGNSDDETNIDNTFLRGIQPTDSDGVAQFKSVFPGHYTGRATHIHVMVHTNATLQNNKTLGNDVYASHVGQAFFDQDLITAVEKVEPYSSNTQDLTTNEDDSILGEEAEDVDPLMSYVYLSDDVASGLFAWIAFGINTTYSDHVTPAAFLYESGGVENPDSGMGGGGGPGGSPPDGAPSGGMGGGNGTGPGNSTAGVTPSPTNAGSDTTTSSGADATTSTSTGTVLLSKWVVYFTAAVGLFGVLIFMQ